MASITIWNRVEPRPRANDISVGLRAEVRDPLWLLARQWQLGELTGADGGSPAYARVVMKTAPMTDWNVAIGQGEVVHPLDGSRPLETAALSEPHGADVATKVELAQTFFALLEREVSAGTAAALEAKFIAFAPLTVADSGPFDPRDAASAELIDLVAGRAADGVTILGLGLGSPPTVPPEITTVPAEVAAVGKALTGFADWVRGTFGAVGGEDPTAWQPRRLEYQLGAGADVGDGRIELSVAPGPDGVIDWSSFDVTSAGDDPFGQLPAPEPRLVIPTRVRYPGLPWSRFWRFEEGDTSLPNVQIDPPELIKLVVLDFAIKAGVDWFDLALSQPVGTLAQIQSLLVKDVFGFYTVVDRADPAGTPAGLTRWTLYSLADNARRVAGLTVLPPSPGRMTAVAPPVEHVRFARDDNAALAWGIEAVTESAIGEPRRGSERDAAVNASLPPPAPSADTISPLRYLLENRVPIQWIPFVPVQTDTTTGTTELQRGVVAVPTPTGGVGLAFATGKILNPQSVGADQPYLLPDEEVPRAGVRVERFVTRARWIDGSAHLWVQRSRRTGSGETQSGLAFDLALPVRR